MGTNRIFRLRGRIGGADLDLVSDLSPWNSVESADSVATFTSLLGE
jgi:hypothetical protein